MNTQSATDIPLNEVLTDAIRWWEKRRIGYNLVLAVVVITTLVLNPPASGMLSGYAQLVLPLFILAILANACYCTAYLVDIPLQLSDFREPWRRRRILLWIIGTLFATALAYFLLAVAGVMNTPF